MRLFFSTSVLVLLHSSSVHAHPVETSVGTEPHVTYTGNFSELGTANVTLITVPAGQDLIISTALCNGNCLLSIDGSPVVSESMHATDHNYSGGVFVSGNANLVVSSGSTLAISISTTDNISYFVNGRLVQQNHPRRTFFGTVGSTPSTLLTNTSSEVFVITSMITSSSSVDVYQDNTKLYDSRSYGSYYGMCNSLCQGNVSIPIAAGTSLKLESHNGYSYEYYVEGYYTQP